MEIKKIYIVNHTHWDREWYLSFEQYRIKLINGVKYIIDSIECGRIDNFYFDGQTAILEDLQEIIDEKTKKKFLQLIKKNKIEIGPWYILPDEFTVDGESFIENLRKGIGDVKKYGSKMSLGYLPDTFGHVSQIPQILKKFNIENMLIHRGANSKTFETEWKSPDGSSVTGIVLPLMGGYYQTMFHATKEKFLQEIDNYISETKPYLTTDSILIMNGCDHTYIPVDMKEKVELLKDKYPDMIIKQVTMSEYIEKIKFDREKMDVLSGEQREVGKAYVLPGVLSTRTYLKRGNRKAIDLVAFGAEPLIALLDNHESDKLINYHWRTILNNQAHDSICGCSVDEVHEENDVRHSKVISSANQFIRESINNYVPYTFSDYKSIFNNKLYIYNSNPYNLSQLIEVEIHVPEKIDKENGMIELYENCKKIEFEVLSKEVREELLVSMNTPPSYQMLAVYKVAIPCEFNGIEVVNIDIKLIKEKYEKKNEVKNKFKIQNKFYEISICNDELMIKRKSDNKAFTDMHKIISILDAGDTYNYSPPKVDNLSSAIIKNVETKANKLSSEIIVHYEIKTPEKLSKCREKGVGEVKTYIRTSIKISNVNSSVLFKTEVNNNSCDQKLKLGFNLSGADNAFGDTAFDMIKRTELLDRIYDAEKNKEVQYNQYPSLRNIYVPDCEMQITHLGIYEFEIEKFNNENYVFMTLLRSVGYLSRRDLRSRGGGAGPGYETPGAQCLGKNNFEYSLDLYSDRYMPNKYLENYKSITHQSTRDYDFEKLFMVSNKSIGVSRISPLKEGYEIRLYNPLENEVTTEISFSKEPTSIKEINLLGNVIRKVNSEKITIGAKQVVTILVKK